MSFEKISKKKFNFCVLISALPHSKLYSVRKIVVQVETCRLISSIVEDGRYPVEPVKAPHGFPLDRITLYQKTSNQEKCQ